VEAALVPNETVVGVPVHLAFVALDAQGALAFGFGAACVLAVTENPNGSTVPAWVNTSFGSALRAANGTFGVLATDWTNGWLNLNVSVAAAVPVTVRLEGPLLPALPAPVVLSELPDLSHLVLYGMGSSTASARTNDTFWHVRDRFGNPAPGALLVVAVSNGSAVRQTFVAVTWTSGGATGAWVNYSVPGTGSVTVTVSDQAGADLLGPIVVPAQASANSSSTASLSPLVVAVVVLLVVGAVVGMTTLLTGGRTRSRSSARTDEEELQRLAEGRETIVGILRHRGPLALREIEAAWEPPPPPSAVAEWVAALVTDGTLTAALGEDREARFALAEKAVPPPPVTLDEDALEREIARRDAAVERDDETPP